MDEVKTDATQDAGDLARDVEETGVIMKACAHRLAGIETLLNEKKEGLAYSLAEIMVAAKNLYTKALPQFVQMEGYSEEELFDALAVLRMHLIDLRDLIDGYEESFLASLACDEQEGAQAEEEDEQG